MMSLISAHKVAKGHQFLHILAGQTRHFALALVIGVMLCVGISEMSEAAERAGSGFARPNEAQLAAAVARDDTGAIRRLVSEGASPNARGSGGNTPVFLAVVSGRLQALSTLLASGGDPNLRRDDGETPVNMAARREDPTALELLLSAGGNPNAKGESDIPALFDAVMAHKPRNVRLLASAGAELNIIWGGGSALHRPLVTADFPLATLLLELGIDPSLKNRAGKTPIEFLCALVDLDPRRLDGTKGLAEFRQALERRGIDPLCLAKMER